MPGAGDGQLRLGPVSAVTLGRDTPQGSPHQVGQLYRARVERAEADGGYILRAGAQTLRLGAGMQLSVGQEVLIRLTTGSDGPRFTVLRALTAAREQAPAAASDELVNALQRMAVRQQPLGSLLAHLAPAENDALQAAVALLRASFATPGKLTRPDRLRDVIHDSGLLLESRLAAATAAPDRFPDAIRSDFKLLLWRLLGDAGVAGDEGFRALLEGLIAHISLRQLRAVRHAEEGHFFWSLELPLEWGRQLLPVSITLRRERAPLGAEPPDSHSWEVAFSLDVEPMGALDVRLFLRRKQLSVSLEAERPETVAALRSELEKLREALSLQGFSVDSIVSRPGAAAAGADRAESFREVSALGRGS